ncbi:uncharacterized protein DFL_003182 [Arthrobotrys flagrans]|uniref:Uncharacterized protein n=1 Tax=Arthrobotrys flagrans TaxID=97331 RepID=A0A437A0W8_ARTFL|nr:hypothetical protein DFL_003182 [Arthrobotrys flagrans]
MGDEKSKDAVRKRDLELARDAIKSGTLTRKFAQNLLGETPQNWTRWTAGEGGLFYDQFFCDYGKHVKIAIAIPNIMRRGNRVDYDVPTKELVRGLNLLIEGFTTSTIGPDGPFFQNGNRIARSCLWNGNTTDPPRELNQTFGYFGNVAAKQWSEASSSPTFSPSHVESYDWPWRINVTRLYEDDPYKYFSPIAY